LTCGNTILTKTSEFTPQTSDYLVDIDRIVENFEQTYDLLKHSKDKTAIDGFKEITMLYLLPYWNLILTDTLDAMHQMFKYSRL
jgi:hypothetical protein